MGFVVGDGVGVGEGDVGTAVDGVTEGLGDEVASIATGSDHTPAKAAGARVMTPPPTTNAAMAARAARTGCGKDMRHLPPNGVWARRGRRPPMPYRP